MTRVVLVVALVVLGASYLTWTAGRIDRLHVRVEAARAALDAQLVRRAAAAQELARHALAAGSLSAEVAAALQRAAASALGTAGSEREAAEDLLSLALSDAVHVSAPADDETARLVGSLDSAAARVGFARQFYNEAVRDTRNLRARRIPRLVRLAGRAPLPEYFELRDAPVLVRRPARGGSIRNDAA